MSDVSQLSQSQRVDQSDQEKTLVILDPVLRRGFTATPNEVLLSPGLSLAAKTVYALLLLFAWRDGECFPGQEKLARAAGCTDRTIRKYLDELRSYGLISWLQRGLNQTNIYYIHDLGEVEALKALSHKDRKGFSGPDRKDLSGQDRKGFSDKEDPVEEYSSSGYMRAREDTCTMCTSGATRASTPAPHSDTPADLLRPTVAEARAMVKQITGVELAEAVLEKMAAYDDEQIHNAVMVLNAYLSRNDVDDVGGFLLEALAEGWQLGTPAPRRKREPKRVARASKESGQKHQVSLNSLYV
ncbi:MAG: helix-turn-helix domain-containing protein [Bacillota bacterium]